METCFLFADHWSGEQILSLGLDNTGEQSADLLMRTAEEIRALHAVKTIVVVPTALASIHLISLPWLSEGKARVAIPYALEEQLAQSMHTLHYAFNRQFYQADQYLVAVIDKTWLEALTDRLLQHGIDFDAITLDWFALKSNELCVVKAGFLVNSTPFKGALPKPMLAPFLTEHSALFTPLYFSEHTIDSSNAAAGIVQVEFPLWVAKRLLHQPYINLCQGEFQQGNTQENNRYWYKVVLAMAIGLLFSFLAMGWMKIHQLNRQIQGLDQQISVIYHEFFPEAKVVISPKFRISQLLKSGSSNQSMAFWQGLGKFSEAYTQHPVTITQFRFENQRLTVNIGGKDFDVLAAFQQGLLAKGLHVIQRQAASKDGGVVAALEITW